MKNGSDPRERLLRHVAVDQQSECWNWTGCLNENDYGQFSLGGKRWLAHRASYTLVVGPIPAGLVLDHTCKNHKCVSPAHLEPVTQLENVLRGDATKYNKSGRSVA